MSVQDYGLFCEAYLSATRCLNGLIVIHFLSILIKLVLSSLGFQIVFDSQLIYNTTCTEFLGITIENTLN
jgi:hypothetical protein